MQNQDVRTFKEVSKAISRYAENSDEFLEKIRTAKDKKIIENKEDEVKKEEVTEIQVKNEVEQPPVAEITLEPTVEIVAPEPGEEPKENENKNDLKNIKNIDENTIALLYKNNYRTVEDVKNSSLKELSKIEGIKKRTAKKILKEVVNAEMINLK
jgi:hypothetical protein